MKMSRTVLIPLLLLAVVSAADATSLQERIDAAQHTANSDLTSTLNNACSELHDPGFYWEIGDANGIKDDPVAGSAAGTVHPNQ